MTGPELRDDYEALTPWARQLYQEGKSTADVMRALYGVDLPAEAYAFDRAYAGGLDLPLQRLKHPWELLAVAPEDAAADLDDIDEDWSAEQEANALAHWPRFLPLMQLRADDATHGGHVIGYNLDELAAGKPTIWGFPGEVPEAGGELAVLGPSLLAVLHTWLADHHRMLEAQRSSPANRGFGSLTNEDVEQAADQLYAIEVLQREVDAR